MGTIVGGKYRLRRALGEGAMGSVWSAVHEVLGREVAIKFLARSFEDASTARERFAAEAKAAALVKHRFVVDVFDFGITEGGAPYMVQELLEGRPLSDLLTDGPAWSLRDAVRFMMDCLSGLSAVHERGIVHRDLKPENIFVIPEVDGSVPKLLDFGISKSAEPARARAPKRPSLREPGKSRLTAQGTALGTPAYMSPEQLRNLSTLDARADLYSLGVVFYEWLAGHCPYATSTDFGEMVEMIEARSMAPLQRLRPELGAALAAVVMRALEPDREQRYGSALEMRSALAQLLPDLPDAATRVQRATLASVRLPPLRMQHFAGPQPTLASARGSLRPASVRRGPSWKLWSGMAILVGLTLGTTLAMRSQLSHAVQPVEAAPAATLVPPAVLPPPSPAREVELPYGALPPDNPPDQELSAPTLANVAPERRRASKPEPAEPRAVLRSRAEPRASTPKPTATQAAPKQTPESDKLLRALDF